MPYLKSGQPGQIEVGTYHHNKHFKSGQQGQEKQGVYCQLKHRDKWATKREELIAIISAGPKTQWATGCCPGFWAFSLGFSSFLEIGTTGTGDFPNYLFIYAYYIYSFLVNQGGPFYCPGVPNV